MDEKIVENRTFDEERALYGQKGLFVRNCRFDGPADGESAFKECESVTVDGAFMNLRYPFWHDRGLTLRNVEMTELCRAALWYSEDVTIKDSRLHGIKALRECGNVRMSGCDIVSPEFGWSTRGIEMEDCTAESEYFMMRSSHLFFRNVRFSGKYSFQYIEDAVFEGCLIQGTQPLCYCEGLRLVNCRMEGCDLAFERSHVRAEVTTPVVSVKNPLAGSRITLPAVGEVIRDIEGAMGVVEVTGE